VEVNVRDAVAVLNYMDYYERGTWGDGMPWGDSDERAYAVAKATGWVTNSISLAGWQNWGWVDESITWATNVWSGAAPAIVIDETHVWNRDQMELAKEAVKRCLKG
jgi:hypothetical protein